ncbi:DUF5339 family protein [Pseudomonas sp. OV226]|jgi:hypothetical protein|uniref:DUF5339 family protein n=1 Tax=Pseudomonas sp. OV226 TaxID=2135588 RepID=UPI000D78E9BB|nr:DUF5339 family protein [Pseudomonas sp. OV226]PWK30234.1 hypothetical protein C7534_12918 [Pseudomonas sp. OV226]
MKKFSIAIMLACLSSAAMAADVSPSCEEYFKQIDQFVSSSPQAEAMKAQYDTAKKQMSEMPSSTQDAACKQASEMMKQAMENMPKK